MVTIFVEGTAGEINGSLRKGFRKLFEQKGFSRFSIVLGEGRPSTINKFIKDKTSAIKLLLIDLEGPESTRSKVFQEFKLDPTCCFCMVQAMEAWFFSQPDLLEKYFNKKLPERLRKKSPQHIEHPSSELAKWSSNTQKGKYHKVRHASELLERLSLQELQRDFEDVEGIVTELKKKAAL